MHSDTSIAEDLELRSEEVQEILSKPPSWIIRWGITLVLFLVIIFVSLSFIIKYPDVLSAKVIVTTEQPPERIIARTAGQMDSIFTTNGEEVTAGKSLAIIKNTATFEDVMLLKMIIDTLQINSTNFSFPMDKTASLSLGDIEVAYIDFERSYVEYFLLKSLNPYSNQLSGDKETLDQVKIRLRRNMELLNNLQQEYELKKVEINRYKGLFQKGVIAEQDFEQKKMELLQTERNLGNLSITISQMEEAISSANQTLRSTIISEQQDNTKFYKNLVLSLNNLKRAIREWEFNYLLSASISGTISFQEYWGSNQYISAGDHIFTILPKSKSKLVGKLTIPSQNAGKIKVGQKVFIKLDNYPYQQFGMVIGEVKNMSISPDSEGNYVIYINLPNELNTSYNQKLELKQELLGSAEIVLDDLSLAERLFYKFKDVFKYE